MGIEAWPHLQWTYTQLLHAWFKSPLQITGWQPGSRVEPCCCCWPAAWHAEMLEGDAQQTCPLPPRAGPCPCGAQILIAVLSIDAPIVSIGCLTSAPGLAEH